MTRFRTAKRDELDRILDWAAAEGWNPGLGDAAAFWAADPEGFFIALDGDQPVAAISVVNHSDTFAFLGLYIVTPPYRGRGIGYGLWQDALAHAGNRTIGLDGVPEQQANYEVSGFRQAGGTTRYSAKVAAQASTKIRLATKADIPALNAKEAAATGIEKHSYLSTWFTNTKDRKTIVADHGFCTIRQCKDGAKIGPLLASDPQTAHQLIQHAASLFGPMVTVDVPNASTQLSTLAEDLGMEAGFQTARMYLGKAPVQIAKLFAVTSLELG